METALTEDEMARWTAWKRATDAVWDGLARALTDATGMSGSEFAVLSRVVEIGDGELRQQALAQLLGWQRSRLSRLLARMEERGYVVRDPAGSGRTVRATPAGRKVLAVARPAHAAAVRRLLLEAVPAQRDDFWETIDAIGRREPNNPFG